MAATPRLDRTVLKVNQAFIVGLLFLSFLLGEEWRGSWLVGATALAMTLGALVPRAAPFFLLYRRVLQPARLLKPRLVEEDPRPHLFALGLGAGFTWASFVSLLAGLSLVGWVLSWIVIVLALINLTVNF